MDTLRLVALLIYTFGALTYGALLVVWARELGRVGWGGRGAGQDRTTGRRIDLINGTLTIVSFLWFCALIAQILVAVVGGARVRYWPLETVIILLSYSFPPLIMHVTWAETARLSGACSWRYAGPLVIVAYIASAAIPAAGLSVAMAPGVERDTYVAAVRALNAGLSVLFISAAVFAIVLLNRARGPARGHERARRWSLLTLFGVMLMMFAAIFIIGELQGGGPMYPIGSFVEVLAKSLPLLFVFVSTYYENRFQFFDLFVKRGLSLLALLAVLTLWLTATLPALRPLAGHAAAPWLFALALLPVLALAPWLHARIGAVLDRRWLGRRFSTVEALTRFLAGLRSATSEPDLIVRAQQGLEEIFRARAVVELPGTALAVDFEVKHETTVRSAGEPAARFLLGTRASDAPYFSQDAALLRSLGDVFASVLDNLRLQQRRLTEEQRAQELSLSASRSELKALRAQINPHFLFNALNAIAGLIHQDPAVADRTVEKLADVFRYTLRGSETEWTVLEDEIDFVRAYLDVEQARFGDRLEAVVQVDDRARGARLPTMIVQTLVENAVKHGASTVRGRARIEVRAEAADGRLSVSVSDNGSGVSKEVPAQAPRHAGGYGLANIRERLAGYFGGDAELTMTRDAAAARTVVTVTLPLLSREPLRAAGELR